MTRRISLRYCGGRQWLIVTFWSTGHLQEKSKINVEPLFGSWRPHCGKYRLSLLASLAALMNALCCWHRAAFFPLSLPLTSLAVDFFPQWEKISYFTSLFHQACKSEYPRSLNALSLRACYVENDSLKMKACLWRGGGSPPCDFKPQDCKELFFFGEAFNPAFTDASATSSSFLSGV